MVEIFNIDLIDGPSTLELFVRFLVNFIFVFVIVRFLYYRVRKRKDYFFTYIIISTVIFLLCFLLENVKLEIGFALGLFAIFGIIRYRTRQIPIKEMTYLFLVIGISVINALANKKISYAELLLTNTILVITAYFLERMMLLRHESTKSIVYEKIELIKPETRSELKRDLEERTGLKINRVEVGKIDFLRDTARVDIYYFESENQADDADIDGFVNDDDD
ncbi:DUF4956 domain-containing protein [Saccharicrinis sp. FJH54]|uniref:DUF4956 domain-containing protein n=1 Tax=Saccharicrinis sp. FJH54 TaxID=3344665 RepID=UPI0035D4B33D